MENKRYYAIVHPIRAQYLCTLSQARKVIVGIWVASFVLATPTVLIQVYIEDNRLIIVMVFYVNS